MLTPGRAGPGRGVAAARTRLAVWDMLLELGYQADGLYLGLGIGDYSDASASYARAFAAERGPARCIEVDLRDDYGYDVPTAAAATSRVPCSACGLSKRHLFDQAAVDGGYDVVVTGHNLDDEAAVLFGNTLRWDIDYLGPPAAGAARPATASPEGEAAGAPDRAGDGGVLRRARHRLHRRGVPDGRRQQAPRLQGGAQRHRGELARQRRPRSTSGSSSSMAPLLAGQSAAADRTRSSACTRCGAPTTGERVRVLPAGRARPQRHEPVPVELVLGEGETASMNRPFAYGEQGAAARHQEAPLPRSPWPRAASSTRHAGFVAHAELIGQPEGIVVAVDQGRGRTPRCARRSRTSCSRCRAARR